MDSLHSEGSVESVSFFIECLPQKLENHRSQQAFPKNILKDLLIWKFPKMADTPNHPNH